MSVSLEMDTKELQKALQIYSRATGKDEADIVNKACLNILIGKLPGSGQKPYGVISNTPKSNPAKIVADLTNPDTRLAIKFAAKALKGSGPARTKSGKISKSASSSWSKRVGRKAKEIIRKRKSSVGYFQSGWINLVRAFGGTRKIAAKDQRTKLGHHSKATTNKLEAFIANSAKDIDKSPKAVNALRRAVSGAAKDMGAYAAKKLQKTADKFKGGGFFR